MIVLAALIIIFFGLMHIKRNYGKEEFKEEKIKIGLGLSAWLVDRFNISERIGSQKLWEAMDGIGSHDEPVKKVRIYFIKKIHLSMLIILIALFLSLGAVIMRSSNSTDEGVVRRPQPGSGDDMVSKTVRIDQGNEQQISFSVSERVPTGEEIQEIVNETKAFIDSNFLGDNTSADNVYRPLNLMGKCEESGADILWITDEEGYINPDGSVENIYDSEGLIVTLTAIISYMDYEEKYIIPVKIMPNQDLNSEIQMLEQEIINVNEDNVNAETVVLPTRVGNSSVEYISKENNDYIVILVIGVVAALTIFIAGNKDIKARNQMRKEEMLVDFPEIIRKYCVLLKAGMTLRGAWGKIVEDYRKSEYVKNGTHRYAYDEMVFTWNEMSNGISEITAYENFGKRCNVIQYGKFATWIVQHGKKGSGGLIDLLESEIYEAKEERNKIIRIRGEKISTRLLGPMLGLMVIVMAIVMIPAFMGIF